MCTDLFENKSIKGVLEVILIIWLTFLIPNISVLAHISGLFSGIIAWLIEFILLKMRENAGNYFKTNKNQEISS